MGYWLSFWLEPHQANPARSFSVSQKIRSYLHSSAAKRYLYDELGSAKIAYRAGFILGHLSYSGAVSAHEWSVRAYTGCSPAVFHKILHNSNFFLRIFSRVYDEMALNLGSISSQEWKQPFFARVGVHRYDENPVDR